MPAPLELDRRTLLGAGLIGGLLSRSQTAPMPPAPSDEPASPPLLFVGHGSPMNAIEDNRWSRAFSELGAELARASTRPRAVLSISAHWYGPGPGVTRQEHPPTIHDFGGFPRELFEMQYPAPGSPALAGEVLKLLEDAGAVAAGPAAPGLGARDAGEDWGLDHGTWSVLHHLLPAADVPVVQLRLDASLSPARHLELGRLLRGLRAEGVLILGSGNVVHHLGDYFARLREGDASTPDWARSFDAEVERAALQGDGAHLARLLEGAAGRRAHPTPEHYLPLLYVVGAAEPQARPDFPITGFDASLSMRALRYS